MSETWDATPIKALRSLPPVPGIVMGTDLERVTTEAIGALAEQGDLYQRGGELVEVITDAPMTTGVTRYAPVARIHRCSEHRIHERMSRVQWTSISSRGETRIIKPPLEIARKILARGSWHGVPTIVQVLTAPTLRPDGSLLSDAGYDPTTGVFLAPTITVDVPDDPSVEDARAAAAKLLDAICDFPATSAGRSAWLATLLSVVARPAIDGPVPMLIINGTVAGTGKGLSVDVLSWVAVGAPATKALYSGEDAETRKAFTAVLLVGDPLIVLDNVEVELGDQALDKLLTDTIWSDRILGRSEKVDIPVRLVVAATGNGIAIRGDLRRRALLMQLEATVEHPEERTGFRHPRLLEHVRERRAALLSAALTIVRAYVVAGRPDMQLRPMGSYEAWTSLIRSALVWADLSDPCDTVLAIRAADTRTDSLRAVVEAWPAADEEIITSVDLLDRATVGSEWRSALLEWCPPRRGTELPNGRELGIALGKIRRRIVAGRLVDRAGRGRLGVQWVRLPAAARDSVYSVHPSGSPPCEPGKLGGEYENDAPASQSHSREPGEDDEGVRS